jgi:hypothetical protein
MVDSRSAFEGPDIPSALTVTLFGVHDSIGEAISDELERRGCRTHAVSVESGWLGSATNAIVRLDTAAGTSALKALTAADGKGVHVVATCADTSSGPAAERLQRLCEECSQHHEVSLIWHGPIATEPPFGDEPRTDEPSLPAQHLALAVVNEVTDQAPRPPSPSFSSRSIAV